MGTKREVREWLSLAPADFPVWGAAACIVVMRLAQNAAVDWTAAVLATVLTVAACLMGMKPDEQLSGFTNWVKKVTYPLCVVAVVVFTYLNFTRWN